jgi:hypothetical protein
MTFSSSPVALLAVAFCFAAPLGAQNVRDPQPTAIVDVRLSSDPDAARVGIVLRDGRIERILAEGEEPPPGVLVIEGDGALALPAFIDAYATSGFEVGEREAAPDMDTEVDANVHIDMRRANRKGLRPSFRVVDALSIEEGTREGYRNQGFAALHSCPAGEILGGLSAVMTLREASLRECIVAAEVFATAEFRASGRGYPRTLMGYHAQLRQFFLDARWQEQRLARYASGEADRRPPFDPELEAAGELLRGERRLLCRANSVRDIRRWLKLAEEHGLRIAIAGGAEAWKVAAELAQAQVPVLLELDWGKEVEDPDAEEESEAEDAPDGEETGAGPEQDAEAEPEAEIGTEPTPDVAPEPTQEPTQEPEQEQEKEREAAPTDEQPAPEEESSAEPENALEYTEPIGVLRERRRLWELKRDCALRLEEAGVVFAFGSSDSSSAELIKGVRALVQAGLDESIAIRALTQTPAALLGLEQHLGELAPGFDADIALWTLSPFKKKAHLDWLFIDGAAHEYKREDQENGEPAEGVDLTGGWSFSYEGQDGPPATMELVMDESGAVTGTLSFTTPDGTPVSSAVEGNVRGADFSLHVNLDISGWSAKLSIEGQVDGDEISGDATWKYSGGEDSEAFDGKRLPEDDKPEDNKSVR